MLPMDTPGHHPAGLPGADPSSPSMMSDMPQGEPRANYTDVAWKHRLTEKDPEKRTAVCSICGPVRLARNGKGWVCSVKKADLRASYYNRNKRVSKPSPHALVSKDVEHRLGVCPVCGPVDIVPYARGWACANRAAELHHSQDEPHRKCSVCGNYDSRHNPVSPTPPQRCEACARLLFTGTEPNLQAEPRAIARAYGGGAEAGAHVVSTFEWLNPEFMPDYETAVPGWKTLGAK